MSKSAAKSRKRTRLLKQARVLAGAGLHPDGASVVTHLREVEAFTEVRSWLEDVRFVHQLNQICARGQLERSRLP
ncbi:hypothetical protein [uncultured Enterovirga sp.]|uniref:hypothetical protein n=1 Tax=uncultured Enterovirga sp. TaxID=2026352 RepID=UPI0035CC7154